MSFNKEQVRQFIYGHYRQEVTNVMPIGAGEWSQAFSFRLEGIEYVIRFGAHKEDFEKDQRATSFTSESLVVPKVKEIGQAFDHYFAVSERAYGEMLDELSAARMRNIVPAALQMLDALREIDTSSTEGYGQWNASGKAPFETWKDYLLSVELDDPMRRTHGWCTSLAQSPVGDTAFKQAFERLKQLAAQCSVERNIIHSDLLNRNVLVDNGKISAVIDWGNAMYGDFLYDLAWFSYWSYAYLAMEGINWEAEARKHFAALGLVVPNMEERLLCCKIHIGLDAQAYNAFTKRWDELELNAKKTLELCGA